MQENSSQNVKKILSYLKNRLNITSDSALAKYLEVKPNTISNWKKRNTLDYKLIINVCVKESLNLNEVFSNTSFSDQNQTERVPLIAKDGIHSYTIGHMKSLDDLPFFKLPFLQTSTNRVFQMTNNDMFPTFHENDYLICMETTIDAIDKDQLIVCISKNKGFFVNRVLEKMGSQLTLQHDNKKLRVHQVALDLNEIDEVWEVKARLICQTENEA